MILDAFEHFFDTFRLILTGLNGTVLSFVVECFSGSNRISVAARGYFRPFPWDVNVRDILLKTRVTTNKYTGDPAHSVKNGVKLM